MDDATGLRYVVVVQCDQVTRQTCPGFNCEFQFTRREGKFDRYPAEHRLRYLTMSCGGCPGRPVSRKLALLKKRLKAKEDLEPTAVVVHLASCITTANHHGPRCPHVDYLRQIVTGGGYEVVEGSYVSKLAEKRRQDGIYPCHE